MHPVGVNTEMLFPQLLSLEMGNLGYECESAEQSVQEFNLVSDLLPFLFVFILENIFTGMSALGWLDFCLFVFELPWVKERGFYSDTEDISGSLTSK